MMCARLLTAEGDARPGLVSRATLERFFDGLVAAYDRALIVALRHRLITLDGDALDCSLRPSSCSWKSPKGFFPRSRTPALIVGHNRGSAEYLAAGDEGAHAGCSGGGDKRIRRLLPAKRLYRPGGSTVTENNGRMFITFEAAWAKDGPPPTR